MAIVNELSEIVLFSVADMLLGVPTRRVKGILKDFHLTPVRRAPDHVRGVMNLRGDIVSVLDMRRLFNYESTELNRDSAVMITLWKDHPAGLLVDKVDDVININADELLPPLANLDESVKPYIIGIYKREESLAAVLNLELLLER